MNGMDINYSIIDWIEQEWYEEQIDDTISMLYKRSIITKLEYDKTLNDTSYAIELIDRHEAFDYDEYIEARNEVMQVVRNPYSHYGVARSDFVGASKNIVI